ncbi:XRE family transcriptional regulator [Streptomyces sp. NPDC001046]|uniref:XRE family transcriptional regulator n=1 Tax=Streptomyces sp. NPDC001046 TaxID=3364543 RepID=UPI0036BD455C
MHQADPATQPAWPDSDDATQPAALSFAEVLQGAVRHSGLSLERVQHRLAAEGLRISLTTLSYWQRGRSEPERADSLRAVDALERILTLPPGALRSLLRPYRPRGRMTAPGHDLCATQRVLGENSLVEQALGAGFGRLNEALRTLSIREAITLDAHRRVVALSIQQLVRATGDGADRLTAVHTFDSGMRAARARVRCGLPGPVRALPELNTAVVEVRFGRALARNETAVVDYTVRVVPGDGTDDHYERRTRTRLRDHLLQVYFHPAALPVACHRYYRERSTAPHAYNHRLLPDASHSVHSAPGRCPAGIHGIAWRWPDSPAAGG